jgi:hypothetical protein
MSYQWRSQLKQFGWLVGGGSTGGFWGFLILFCFVFIWQKVKSNRLGFK